MEMARRKAEFQPSAGKRVIRRMVGDRQGRVEDGIPRVVRMRSTSRLAVRHGRLDSAEELGKTWGCGADDRVWNCGEVGKGHVGEWGPAE